MHQINISRYSKLVINEMKPFHPPKITSSNDDNDNNKSSHGRSRNRRCPNLTLTLPLPQRQQPQIAKGVPLPLPPSSSCTTNQHQYNLSELDRINRIGSGSGGTVYKVIHRPTGTVFALKVIYGNHEEDVRRHMLREIEILRSVDNLNVVKCHDMFDRGGEIQVLLEYMDCGSLQGTHLSRDDDLAHITRQMLLGLYYLHRHKIVHRDIKPSNLLINSKKQVKIADFGVSRILEQTMDPCNSAVGTIAYMSPERINTDLNQGKYDGCAGDIWSVGVSILELYMGRYPFEVAKQGDWASLMCAICMSQPPQAPPTSSPQFRNFVRCCLQSDPARRWTAAQLLRHPFLTTNNTSTNFSVNNNIHQAHQLLPPPPQHAREQFS